MFPPVEPSILQVVAPPPVLSNQTSASVSSIKAEPATERVRDVCVELSPIFTEPPEGQSEITLSVAAFPVLVSYGCITKPVLPFEVNTI